MSEAINSWLCRQIDEYTGLIESFGISIEYGTNFNFFHSIPKTQPLRHHINPAFNPKYANLRKNHVQYIIGRGLDGEIVHTQAIKLIDLNNVTFEEYLRIRFWDFRSHGYHFDPAKTSIHLTNAAASITGLIAYHGELWSKGGPGGIRGGSLTILLTRLMLLRCLQKWSPDFLFGFQSPMTTCRGLAVREGYMRLEQRSVLWYQKNSAEPMEDWLVWMSRKEALFNLRLPASFFHQLLEKPNVAAKISHGEIRNSA